MTDDNVVDGPKPYRVPVNLPDIGVPTDAERRDEIARLREENARLVEAVKIAIENHEIAIERSRDCGEYGTECFLQDCPKDYHLAGDLVKLRAALTDTVDSGEAG